MVIDLNETYRMPRAFDKLFERVKPGSFLTGSEVWYMTKALYLHRDDSSTGKTLDSICYYDLVSNTFITNEQAMSRGGNGYFNKVVDTFEICHFSRDNLSLDFINEELSVVEMEEKFNEQFSKLIRDNIANSLLKLGEVAAQMDLESKSNFEALFFNEGQNYEIPLPLYPKAMKFKILFEDLTHKINVNSLISKNVETSAHDYILSTLVRATDIDTAVFFSNAFGLSKKELEEFVEVVVDYILVGKNKVDKFEIVQNFKPRGIEIVDRVVDYSSKSSDLNFEDVVQIFTQAYKNLNQKGSSEQ